MVALERVSPVARRKVVLVSTAAVRFAALSFRSSGCTVGDTVSLPDPVPITRAGADVERAVGRAGLEVDARAGAGVVHAAPDVAEREARRSRIARVDLDGGGDRD